MLEGKAGNALEIGKDWEFPSLLRGLFFPKAGHSGVRWEVGHVPVTY